MRALLLLAILSTVICVSVSVSAATLYVDGSVSSSGNGASWETALKTIQEGIDKALEGDTVTVVEGVYVENIQFKGKNIVLTGTGPLDPSIVANTIIDGNKLGSVVTFFGTETEACVLCGFTIRNGNASRGGGICGGTDPGHTHATIENNRITANSTGYYGGGLYWCDGTIQNNTITGNSAGEYGGGLAECNGTIQNNTITGNSAQLGGGLYVCDGRIENNTLTDNSAAKNGGGLYYCLGTIQNNTISENSAAWDGGGLAYCDGTIQNNTITGNLAVLGGGLLGCHGTIQNNTVAGNSAADWGGGLCACGGTIQNNTITGNSAEVYGGGLMFCYGTIRNCIIWGNTAPSDAQVYDSNIPTYCCIQDWSGGAEGNIVEDPRFVDANAGDFRLSADSPCIDAGYNAPELPETDIAGMHRIMFGGKSLTVDMGANEFHIWPPTQNSQTGEITLKWSSLTGKTYSVHHSSDMLLWDVLADNVASAGDTVTTWIDSMGPVLPPGVRIRYYKVIENQ